MLVTAVASGMVGDSLTVLDRKESRTRAGLHVWAVLVAGVAGLLGGLAAAVTGVVPGWAAVVLALAVVAFVLEGHAAAAADGQRRFWSLPAVDMTSLVVSLGTLVLSGSGGGAHARLLLPRTARGADRRGDRRLVAGARGGSAPGAVVLADLGSVWSFGVWRAAAQTIRPGLLTGLRLVVVAAVGAAAYGTVEAARVYTAPTLTVVAGLGSFLLPHYVTMSRAAQTTGR